MWIKDKVTGKVYKMAGRMIDGTPVFIAGGYVYLASDEMFEIIDDPVMSADGKPITVGDIVFHTSGKHGPLRVVGFDTDVPDHPLVVVETVGGERSKCRPQRLKETKEEGEQE